MSHKFNGHAGKIGITSVQNALKSASQRKGEHQAPTLQVRSASSPLRLYTATTSELPANYFDLAVQRQLESCRHPQMSTPRLAPVKS